GRKQQTEKQFDGRRLARAVRAQQAEHLAALNLQIQSAKGFFLSPAPKVEVYLGQLADIDHDLARRCSILTFGHSLPTPDPNPSCHGTPVPSARRGVTVGPRLS